MNKRQEKIIAFLEKEGTWIKGKDLALIMHVSTRTIRSDMEAINDQFEDGYIESSYQQGYRLVLEKKSLAASNTNNDVPQTPKERCDYILKRLLSVKEIHMSDLCEEVFASSYTIEQDLRLIRERQLYDTSLELVYKKGWLKLAGDEYEKRRLFKKLLMSEVEENFFNLDVVAKLYPEFDLYKAKEILSGCMDQYGFKVREMEYPMLLMHIGVALKRMLQFQQLDLENENARLENTVEYEIADDFYNRMGRLYQIEINKNEKQLLALLLLGKKAQDYTQDTYVFKGNVIDLKKLTKKILDAVYDTFGIDLKEDEDLIQGLSLHMQSLFSRVENNTSIHNVYLDEVRKTFPLIYDMAVYAGQKLKDLTRIEISQDEIGFLALHFGASYNKSAFSKRYRAVVIFPDNQTLKNVMIHKVRTQFEERMIIADVLDSFEEKKIKTINPDLILTSTPLNHSLNIPTLEISIFYTSQNEGAIFALLNKLDKEKGKVEFENQIKKLIKPEFFIESLKGDRVENIIRQICTPLIEKGYIPPEYSAAVLERESFAPTSFAAGFALPHAFECDALKSVISVAFLDKPVKWGSYEVDFILLLAIRQADQKLLSVFFDWWIGLVQDDIRFSRLKRQRNYAAFMNAVLEE